jgi:hypothetical protein
VAWARYTASGRAAISYLSARLGEFLAFGREVFGGIADALMAGDLALAGRVAMAGLMVAVRTGQLAIITSWEDLKLRIFGIWDELSIRRKPPSPSSRAPSPALASRSVCSGRTSRRHSLACGSDLRRRPSQPFREP